MNKLSLAKDAGTDIEEVFVQRCAKELCELTENAVSDYHRRMIEKDYFDTLERRIVIVD